MSNRFSLKMKDPRRIGRGPRYISKKVFARSYIREAVLRCEQPLTRFDKLLGEDDCIKFLLGNRVDAYALGFRIKAPEEHAPKALEKILLSNLTVGRDRVGAVALDDNRVQRNLVHIANQPVQVSLNFLRKRSDVKCGSVIPRLVDIDVEKTHVLCPPVDQNIVYRVVEYSFLFSTSPIIIPYYVNLVNLRNAFALLFSLKNQQLHLLYQHHF